MPPHCDAFDDRDRVVSGLRSPLKPVARDELAQAQVTRALVPIRKRMVPDRVTAQHRSLRSEVWICLDTEHPSLRCGKRGFGVDDAVELRNDARLDPEDRFRNEKVIREVKVLNVVYCASLSRISRSSSIIPRRRSWNASSRRRVAI